MDEDSFIKRALMDEFRSTLGDLEDRIGSTGRSGHLRMLHCHHRWQHESSASWDTVIDLRRCSTTHTLWNSVSGVIRRFVFFWIQSHAAVPRQNSINQCFLSFTALAESEIRNGSLTVKTSDFLFNSFVG